MSNKDLWFGYLDAGIKSSPVLIDKRLDTGNPTTQYIFNLTRGEILEYRRELVQGKLRELSDTENSHVKELKSAFEEARKTFSPRVTTSRITTKSMQKTTAAANDDFDVDIDDDDIELNEDMDDAMDDTG